MGTALPDAWEGADRHRRERHSPCGGVGSGVQISGRVQTAQGFFAALSPAKGIKTAPAVWGQTLFGFRLCLGVYRGLGSLLMGSPVMGSKFAPEG